MLKDLENVYDELSAEDKNILSSPTVLRNALTNPVIKLLAVHRPAAVLNFKLTPLDPSKSYQTGENVHLMVNQVSQQVIEKYKDQIIKLKTSKFVTFKLNKAILEGVPDLIEFNSVEHNTMV